MTHKTFFAAITAFVASFIFGADVAANDGAYQVV